MEEVAGVGEAIVGGTKSFLSTIGTGLAALQVGISMWQKELSRSTMK